MIFIIEPDGEQHTRPVKHFGGLSKFIEQVIRDIIKNKYCRENNITLIRISHTVKDVIGFLINRFRKLDKKRIR